MGPPVIQVDPDDINNGAQEWQDINNQLSGLTGGVSVLDNNSYFLGNYPEVHNNAVTTFNNTTVNTADTASDFSARLSATADDYDTTEADNVSRATTIGE